MVTTFCHHDQAKMEASEALSVLHQCDLPEPSVVVVQRYTNSPYLPQGSFSFLYLYVITLSGGASSAQFPVDLLCLYRLLPYSDTKVVLPWEEEKEGLNVYPFFWETLWTSSEGEHYLSDPIPLSVSLLSPIPIKKRVPRWKKDWAFTQPSNSCKISTRPQPAGM